MRTQGAPLAVPLLLAAFVGRSQSGTQGSAAWDMAPYLAPTLASIVVFVMFWIVLQRRVGENVIGELGLLYLGLTVAYTVLPAFAFMVTGLSEGGPLALLLPETADLRAHPWRHVLFESGVAGGYLLLRGCQARRRMAP